MEGLLKKGNRSARPSNLMRSKSGDLDFNPRTDAFALRLGAKFVSDNRYKWGEVRTKDGVVEMLMDRNGMFIDPADCPECGGAPWYVKQRSSRPGAPPWEYELTYCRRCVTPAEVEDARQRAQMYGAGGKKR